MTTVNHSEDLAKIGGGMSFHPLLSESESVSGMLSGRLIFRLSEGGKVIREYDHKNLIVNGASILVASLLKDPSQSGIKYLAIGRGGGASWFTDPPQPTSTQVKLVGEVYRKEIKQKMYVDPKTGDYTSIPSNIVDYIVTFNESEANGQLVEMGMFGGNSATPDADSGILVNYRTFPVISKTSTMSLSVIFRITA